MGTLEQRAALGSGGGMWSTKAVGDVPAVTMTDGPHGLRVQQASGDHLGIGASLPATCFPPAVGLGQSWSPTLAARVGAALGVECQQAGVAVLLGPGINIKRDPRCGRNFEYYSEDPLVTGRMGAAWVSGLQAQGVGASLKHFAAYNTETDRMRSSSNVDPRTLREIYLRAFEYVVRQAQPWTVMCSYNRINGVYAAENTWLLTDVLRGQWGFEGAVVSDWGAVRDRVAAVAAGLDLEMPGNGGRTDTHVVDAVRAGTLDAAAVERSADRVAALAAKATAGRRTDVTVDLDSQHALAREVAAQCIVLLKNDGRLLPLTPTQSIAVIGEFATTPRYQGGGSSHVSPTRLDIPLDEIRARAPEATVTYAPGFTERGDNAAALRSEAVEAAATADVALLFLGLSARQESEGFDREHIDLPVEQLDLLAAVVAVQPRTVVVLSHGGVLRLAPVAALAPAIVDAALLGQAAGGAIADVLLGVVNPSGRLTETVPVRLQDTPSYLNFPGERGQVSYGEGVHVGYRWYDARDVEVVFPFGHGLSYTTFEYSDLQLSDGPDGVTAAVTVTNTGETPGREVVQFYVGVPGSSVVRPPLELKGFGEVVLAPGESSPVTVLLRREDLAYWEVAVDRWVVEDGRYEVSAGASSRDLRLTAAVRVAGDKVTAPFTLESTLGEVMADPAAAAVLGAAMGTALGGEAAAGAAAAGADLGIDMMRMMASIPLDRIMGLTGGDIEESRTEQLLAAINAARLSATNA